MRSFALVAVVSVVVLGGAGVSGAASGSSSGAPAGGVTPEQALSAFETAPPEFLLPSAPATLEGKPVAPEVVTSPGSATGLSVSGGLNGSEISENPSEGFAVSGPVGTFDLAPTDLGPSVSQATLVSGSGVLFANVANSTDELVRP